jgi:hypothetical protein
MKSIGDMETINYNRGGKKSERTDWRRRRRRRTVPRTNIMRRIRVTVATNM